MHAGNQVVGYFPTSAPCVQLMQITPTPVMSLAMSLLSCATHTKTRTLRRPHVLAPPQSARESFDLTSDTTSRNFRSVLTAVLL